MDFRAAYQARPPEIWITPWSMQSLGATLTNAANTTTADQNWIGVGTVIYVPFVVPEPCIATKMGWANGAAVAGNIDVGIYQPDGTLLVSTGSTAQATVSVVQYVDLTDTVLQRGLYYMAMVSDTSGATQKVGAVVPVAGILQSFGLLQQASVTLPLSTNASPATFAKYTQAFLPIFGVQVYRAIS